MHNMSQTMCHALKPSLSHPTKWYHTVVGSRVSDNEGEERLNVAE